MDKYHEVYNSKGFHTYSWTNSCYSRFTTLGIFKLFFTVEILQYIVEQTNKYALECMGQPSFDSWQPLTVADLEAFMGFMLLMGIVNLPALFDYWKSDPVYHYTPIVSRISRTRFIEISKYLHFADNQSLPPTGTPEYKQIGKNPANSQASRGKI